MINEIITLVSLFGAGILLAFTPCMLPIIPILSSIIVGQNKPTLIKSGLLSGSYVLGMSITYAMAGLVVAYLGSGIQQYLQTPAILIITSIMFFVMALSLFDFFELRLPNFIVNKLSNLNNGFKGGTYLGVFLMGSVSSLIVSPCISAPLAVVLTRIAETGNMCLGFLCLFVLGLGMGAPLMLVGMSMGKLLPKAGPWMAYVKKIFGVIIIGISITLLMRVF